MEPPDDSGFDPASGAPDSETCICRRRRPRRRGRFQTAMRGAADGALTSELQRRLTEQQEKYLRLAAEYDNYRKRTTTRARRDARDARRRISSSSCSTALDDLARFAHVDPADGRREHGRAGRRDGREEDAQGADGRRPRDHRSGRTSPSIPSCTRPSRPSRRCRPRTTTSSRTSSRSGYLFNGQLLRPARVVVKQWNG